MRHLITLIPNQPYRFDLLLDLLRRYTEPAINIVYQNALWRVVGIHDELALVKILETDNTLEVYVVKQTGDFNDDDLIQSIIHILGLDTNLDAFYDFAQSNPQLAQIIKPIYGLPIPRTATVFESLSFIIIEQQIAWVAAQKSQRKFLEWAGNSITYDGIIHFAPPTPQQVANAHADQWHEMKITTRRKNLLIDIAQQVVDTRINLEDLDSVPLNQAYDYLCSIKGIGHWTATHTLERALGKYYYVGHNDVALQAAVNHYFFGESGKISEQLLNEIFAEYGEYAGMVAHFVINRWVMDRYTANSLA